MSSLPAGTRTPGPELVHTVSGAFEDMRFTRVHAKIAIALFITFVIESWEQLALVYVSDNLASSFDLNFEQLGVALSAVATGMIPGVLIWGPVADRFGRRPVALISLAAYSLIALAAAFSNSFEMLTVLRILSGVALAGVYTVTFPYFLELMPTKVRGRATVLLSIGWPIGVLAAVASSQMLGFLGWQAVAIASAVAGVWAVFVWAWVPESPYWLASRGRFADVRAVLGRLGVSVAQEARFGMEGAKSAAKPWLLLARPLRRITVLMLILNFAFNWAYWGLQTWLPTLLQQKGLSLSLSLDFVALSALFMIPGYLSASLLTKKFGRKKLFVAYVAGSVLSGLLFAYAPDLAGLYVANFALSFFMLGAWGIWNTWNCEFYPTVLRNTGSSWALAAQLIATAAAPSTVGFLLSQSVDFTGTVVIISGFLLLTLAVSLPLPETEGKELT